MSRPDDMPERLLARDATDFERRVLEAALAKEPPPGSSARIAKALGVTLTATGALPSGSALAAKKVAGGTAAAHAPAAVTPWLPVAVVGLLCAVGAVGLHAWRSAPVAPAGASAAPTVEATPALPEAAPSSVTVSPEVAPQSARLSEVGADLHEQIALLDAARTAVAHDDARRALQVLGRYEGKYPSGSFRPEAAALRIEALVKVGRRAEARALASQFVAEHHGSLLAKKVAGLTGLSRQTASP
ncbi:MAG: hypothetical protein ACJ8F1_04385 [Polyangia bacterium]